MTILDDFVNVIPGAGMIQKAVQGKKVDAFDFLPGSKLATKAIGTVLPVGASLLGSVTGMFSSKTNSTPLTRSGSKPSPREDYSRIQQQDEKDNTMMYIGLGVGGLLLIGVVGYVILKD